jgi:hypothetical protein
LLSKTLGKPTQSPSKVRADSEVWFFRLDGREHVYTCMDIHVMFLRLLQTNGLASYFWLIVTHNMRYCNATNNVTNNVQCSLLTEDTLRHGQERTKLQEPDKTKGEKPSDQRRAIQPDC